MSEEFLFNVQEMEKVFKNKLKILLQAYIWSLSTPICWLQPSQRSTVFALHKKVTKKCRKHAIKCLQKPFSIRKINFRKKISIPSHFLPGTFSRRQTNKKILQAFKVTQMTLNKSIWWMNNNEGKKRHSAIFIHPFSYRHAFHLFSFAIVKFILEI